MCSCGQVFGNPVPEKDDQVGVVYWEPVRPSSNEAKVQSAWETWNGINPAAKAAGFGALAVLLIVFVIAGNHSNATTAGDRDVLPVVTPRSESSRAYIRGRTRVEPFNGQEPGNQPRPVNLPDNSAPVQSPESTPVQATDSATSVQAADSQFDAENESYMEGVASHGITDVNTVRTVAHAILRGYVNDSPVQDASKRETDFEYTRNGLDVLAKYDANEKEAGAWRLASDAAQGQDASAVIQRLNSLKTVNLNWDNFGKKGADIDDGSGLALGIVIMGILKSR